MKAISPLIATVLLIAFVIGVGGLISVFSTSLTRTSTGIASNQSEALSRCAGAWINVFSVTNTTISYTNPTSQVITGLVAIFSDGKQSVTTLDQSLGIGESNTTQITNSTGVAELTVVSTGIQPGGAAGNTSVTVRGQCQSTITVEGKCTSAQACWDF